MAFYALLTGIFLYCVHVIGLGGCNTLPSDWRSKIHSSVLMVLDSRPTSANANWSSRSDILEDDGTSGLRTVAQRTGHLFPYNYWPNNGKCIPFKLHPAFDADAKTRQGILRALRTIERRTQSCLTFKMWSSESEYIDISPGRHCEADVGRTPGMITRVRLGRDCMKPGIILHEMLHALGFFHEHNRPDRDHYLEIFPDHVESGKYDRNFIVLTNMTNHGILYDFESIMHYSPLAFAHNPNNPTMVPKVPLPVKMGQQEYLSGLDVIKLNKAYGCIDENFEPLSHAASLTCTVDHYINEPAASTAIASTTSTDTITHSGGCRSLELKGVVNATWLMRDVDTFWSLIHTATSATVRYVGLLELSSDCQVQKLTGTTNAYGEISLLLSRRHGLQMLTTFEVSGYYPITLRDVPLHGESDGLNIFMEPLLFIPRRFTGLGISTGTLRDFSNWWIALSGVRLDFRSDVNNHTGIPVESITTSGAGSWSVTLPGGHYTVTASKKGYITVPFTVIVIGGKNQDYGVTGLSPILDTGAIRIVSLGGKGTRRTYPVVHVRGPVEGRSERFHFRGGSNVGGANTDVVKYEVSQYEMDSVLVSKQIAGIYRISVSDWELIQASRSSTLWDMANNGARIQLYTGNKLWAQYFMPNRPGSAWSVVEINGTHLNPVNEVNTVSSVDNVN